MEQPVLPESLFAIFLFSFAVGFGAVVSPGPISTAIVSHAPRRGWPVGPLVATGHSLMEFGIAAAILLGLGSILSHASIRTFIAIAGGMLILWMGATLAADAWRGKAQIPQAGDTGSSLTARQFVGLGVVATISNPFWYAWWVTFAAGYLVQAKALSMGGAAAFYLGHISADYAWDTLLSTVVGGGRRWITPRVYRGILFVCGVFLIYLGVSFLIQGLPQG